MMETGALERISDRIEQGEPLADADTRQLTASGDILTLGSLADRVRRRRHGASTTFLRVADAAVNAQGAPPAWPAEAREVRLVGPVRSLHDAVQAVGVVAAAAGTRPVSGLSLAGIRSLAAAEGVPLTAALQRLRDAGLASLAEAPVDVLDDWRAALEAAAAAGLRIARLTIDSPGATVPMLPRVAEACRLAGAGSVFAPLARRPGSEPTTGYEDVRSVALSRLMLDVAHIQVDWRLHGPKLAQVALTVGADDVDNVSAGDEHPEGRRRAPLEEILRNIRAAGLEPVERDAAFAPVR